MQTRLLPCISQSSHDTRRCAPRNSLPTPSWGLETDHSCTPRQRERSRNERHPQRHACSDSRRRRLPRQNPWSCSPASRSTGSPPCACRCGQRGGRGRDPGASSARLRLPWLRLEPFPLRSAALSSCGRRILRQRHGAWDRAWPPPWRGVHERGDLVRPLVAPDSRGRGLRATTFPPSPLCSCSQVRCWIHRALLLLLSLFCVLARAELALHEAWRARRASRALPGTRRKR